MGKISSADFPRDEGEVFWIIWDADAIIKYALTVQHVVHSIWQGWKQLYIVRIIQQKNSRTLILTSEVLNMNKWVQVGRAMDEGREERRKGKVEGRQKEERGEREGKEGRKGRREDGWKEGQDQGVFHLNPALVWQYKVSDKYGEIANDLNYVWKNLKVPHANLEDWNLALESPKQVQMCLKRVLQKSAWISERFTESLTSVNETLRVKF